MPVHEGHRARKKEQFRAHGLDAFADHEVLELLLYYAVPRQDTNPIAHRLMQKFGSLEAVFSADRETLEEVEGVGENASTLLTLMLPLMRRVRASAGAHRIHSRRVGRGTATQNLVTDRAGERNSDPRDTMEL